MCESLLVVLFLVCEFGLVGLLAKFCLCEELFVVVGEVLWCF